MSWDTPEGGPNWLLMGIEIDKLISDKEHVVIPMESETHAYSSVGNCAAFHFEGQAESNAMSSELAHSNDHNPPKIFKKFTL